MDIQRAVKDLNCKANNLLCIFHSLDPLIKTFLLRNYCLSLYGCCLCSLNSSSINVIEIALNKILRENLSSHSHTGIVHCVSQIPSVSNIYIIGLLAFFQKLCCHHLVLLDLFLMSLCILLILRKLIIIIVEMDNLILFF